MEKWHVLKVLNYIKFHNKKIKQFIRIILGIQVK